MTPELNILARQIFNRLDKDISTWGIINEAWNRLPPNIKSSIRREWEQIITEEVARMLHDAEKENRIQALFDEMGIKMKP